MTCHRSMTGEAKVYSFGTNDTMDSVRETLRRMREDVDSEACRKQKAKYCTVDEIWRRGIYIVRTYTVRDSNGNKGQAHIVRYRLTVGQRGYFTSYPNVFLRTTKDIWGNTYDVIILMDEQRE